MLTTITAVRPDSPAALAGIRPGESLLSIDGGAIGDVLDYQFAAYDEDITLTLVDETGVKRELRVHKEPGEDLGLTFEEPLMDEQKTCRNGCVFCFIDQLPKGLRPALYVKDDDARLSLLRGQYITLTNLSEADFRRIERQHISPLRISVHTTDPDLRVRMMRNKNAGNILEALRRFRDAGIEMHTQIVLCPGFNDGPALEKTLLDLTALYPAVQSVSVVPVGLTAHRGGLTPLSPLTPAQAAETLALVARIGDACDQRFGCRVCYAADELYLLCGKPLPPEEQYDDYPQWENGVGMMMLFESQLRAALQDAPPIRPRLDAAPRRFVVATGTAAAPFMQRMLALVEASYPAVHGEVIAIPNRLFGETVTVAGLTGGRDLIEALKPVVDGRPVLLPRSMLSFEGTVFLDDVTLSEVERALHTSVTSVEITGMDFLTAVCGILALEG